MGRWRICPECGKENYSVDTYSFGSNEFCESCAKDIGLFQLSDRLEESLSGIDLTIALDNPELYRRGLDFQDRIYDSYYYALKNKN